MRRPTRWLLPVLLLLAASSSARAVPAFTKEAGVRVSSGTPQSILPIAGGWRMYFVRGGFEVLSASSTDKSAWTVEAGVRLATSTAPGIDASSITACSAFSLSAGGYRMLYAAGSSTGSFSILSATSADGLAWSKEGAVRLQVNTGDAFIGSPRVIPVSAGLLRMYYVQMSTAGFLPPLQHIRSATSSDEGLTWTNEGIRIATAAWEVSVSTLTDGRTRLFFSGLQTGSTSTLQIATALSGDGLAFTQESVVLSTAALSGEIGFPLADRSTETFRWRLYYSFLPAGSTTAVIVSALTMSPALDSLSPSSAFNTNAATAFTLTGEVLGPAPTVALVKGSNSAAATGVTVVSDQQVTGSFPTGGLPTGLWSVLFTNADGDAATLNAALDIDIPGGIVAIKDNLFRPLLGEKAKIDVTVFAAGKLKLKLYTLNGELVKTLLDQDVPAGTTTVNWPGDTGGGHTVASGTYLLSVAGPSTHTTKKIVVIK